MSLLREFEQRIESLLEGFFTRQFKSGVQPVEIAKKLVREMDAHRSISVSKVYVPNHYVIVTSEKDAEKLKPFEKTLISEFQNFLVSHAKKEGYDLLGLPQIEFKNSPKLLLGEIVIESYLESREVDTAKTGGAKMVETDVDLGAKKDAYLVRADADKETRLLLTAISTKIGRASDNQIVIPDPNVSRYHARVENLGSRYILKDLASTNGTFVNGTKVDERILKNGDVIMIGTTKLQFRRESGV